MNTLRNTNEMEYTDHSCELISCFSIMETFITVDFFCCGHVCIDLFISTWIFMVATGALLFVGQNTFLISINLKKNQHTVNRTMNNTRCRDLGCWKHFEKNVYTLAFQPKQPYASSSKSSCSINLCPSRVIITKMQ